MLNNQLWYLNFILTKKKILLVTIFLGIMALLNALLIHKELFTTSDFILFSFLGYGKGYLDFISLLGFIIWMGFPLYLIGVMMSEDTFNNHLFLIRFKSFRKNFYHMQKAYFIYFLFYICLNLFITFIVGSIFSLNQSGYLFMTEVLDLIGSFGDGGISTDLTEHNIALVIGVVCLIRFIELMALQIIFISLYAIIKNTIISFLVSILTYILLIFNVPTFFPLGISSIYRVLHLDENFILACISALIVLLLTYILGYVYVYLLGCKKLFSQ